MTDLIEVLKCVRDTELKEIENDINAVYTYCYELENIGEKPISSFWFQTPYDYADLKEEDIWAKIDGVSSNAHLADLSSDPVSNAFTIVPEETGNVQTKLTIYFQKPLEPKEKMVLHFGFTSPIFKTVQKTLSKDIITISDWIIHSTSCNKLIVNITYPETFILIDSVPKPKSNKNNTVTHIFPGLDPSQFKRYTLVFERHQCGRFAGKITFALLTMFVSGIVGHYVGELLSS